MRIVLTGAESSGKSTLTEYLAAKFELPYALEYAREHFKIHGSAYDLKILVEMSRWHRQFQQQHVSRHEPLGLFDTDLINYKIWSEEVFGCCPQEIIDGIAQESDHVYLLCEPDVPWEPDPFRENPCDRGFLFERHRDEIIRLGRTYEIVRGLGSARRSRAERALCRLRESSR